MKREWHGSAVQGGGTAVIKRWMNRRALSMALLGLFAGSLLVTGCSGGGGVSTEVVSGVAAVGAPLSGEARIKDSSNREKRTIIGNDGSFAFDVSDMKGPFILRAVGNAEGRSHSFQSFAGNPGRANINPLTNVVVALAAGVDDPAEIYENPDHESLLRINSDLPDAVADILNELYPLLKRFDADGQDPVSGHYEADHKNLDGLFDNVAIALADGIVTITNKKTGALIFSGPVSDIQTGALNEANIPGTGPVPVPVPGSASDLSALGGNGQVTLSWTPVAGATSYNLYWSTAPGVTQTSGKKISGAESPYVQTGLAAGTSYFYVVTALNASGEGAASAEASATTTSTPAPQPTVPAAPTGVAATGGTKQVTITWPAVSGATSYNIYWSTASGVIPSTGTKITGAVSPTVQTGLADGATYYYVVTAVNSAGESASSVQVAATTLAATPAQTAPSAPTGLTAAGGANQVSLSWPAVSGATSYNLYRSTAPGVTPSTGTKVSSVTSPYVQTGLSAGTTYFYVVTAVNAVGESLASPQASATTDDPAPVLPAAPTGLTAVGGAKQVTLSWASVSGAALYNLYWSTSPGVTKASGTILPGVSSGYVHTGLADGTAYYYVVAAQNATGEGPVSSVAMATTNAAAPPPPPPAVLCGSCHAIPPSTGQHTFHFPSRINTCATCHGAGYDPNGPTSALPSTHGNGAINIASGNPPGWNATNRTCANACHGTKAW